MTDTLKFPFDPSDAEQFALLLAKPMLDACEEAREWCASKTLIEAWATCPRIDWMRWLIPRLGYQFVDTMEVEVLRAQFDMCVVATSLGIVVEGQEASSHAWGTASATGFRGQASATGDAGQASATGYAGQASATGFRGQASATGDAGQASATGDAGQASATGFRGQASATGVRGQASATGFRGQASATGVHGHALATESAEAGAFGALTFKVWEESSKRYRYKTFYVGELGVEANVKYKLDVAGQLVKAQ